MTYFTRLAKQGAYFIACIALLFITTSESFAQTAPDLGTAATYGAFSGAGAIGNTGLTVVTGDIGTNAGAFTGFPPGVYTGAKHVADAASLSAKNDLTTAYNSMNSATNAVIFDTALNATMGNGQVLTPRTYGRGDLTTISGNLTFDAKGNPAAIFIIKIRAALNVAKNTTMILANGAQAANIYWAVDGAVSVLDNSIFKGTIVANGAIHFYGGASLEGRALAVVGAVTLASNVVSIPGSGTPANSLIVITPAPGDTVRGGTQNYQITWGGSGIASKKTFEYSLDSGSTWTLIGSITADVYTYGWNVPDTSSKRALVRITDLNNLRGISGLFTIGSTKIIVTRPVAGEVITGGTQNFPITWTGTGLAAQKTFEYSLDSGMTWKTIGTSSADVFTYNWNVPDTASTKALVRITDANGITGKSGLFTIKSSRIIVTRPAFGEVINGGTQNYQITWSGTGLATQKTLDYSLDNGLTWKLIGTVSNDGFTYNWNVPDTASTKAIVRITDANGITGRSGVFTIKSIKPNPSLIVVRPALGETIAAKTQNYQIMWTGTGLATQKTFEYSLDGGTTWKTIGVFSTDAYTFFWNVPDTSSTNAVVRITDQNGVTGMSGVFNISRTIPNPGSIVITHPIGGETLDGGEANFLITFTAVNTTPHKTIEYSLDGGATWTLIGFLNVDAQSFNWANVPNVATTQALVRIIDANGVTGTSGLFTIKVTPGTGSINSLTLSGLDNRNNIGNSKLLGISWTYTPDIGTSVEVEYSLDYTTTWSHIATVLVSESSNTSWVTVPTGYHNPVFIRVTSSKGMTRTSSPFSIGTNASVTSNASNNGYSVSNYPNPAGNQTTFNVVLPVTSDVTLTVIDGLGRQLSTIATQHYDAGNYNIPFNTSKLDAGMYTYILQAGATRLVGKLNIVK